jgi:hypothetical protein
VASKDQNIPLNVEQRLMRLLGLKSLDELNRVLSEPPNEQSLREMGPPDDLYELEWADEVIDNALDEIERGDATYAIFVTKSGAIALAKIPTPRHSELRMVREFLCGATVISSERLKPDRCDYVVVRFGRRFGQAESPIYEEL